jgi:hypothetical protein
MIRQSCGGGFWSRGVNVKSGENGDHGRPIDRDVPALPVPVFGGNAEGFSQVVEGRVEFCHGANPGSNQLAAMAQSGFIRPEQRDT